MGNEHHGQAEVLLEIGEQVQDLSADGHVEGRSRLVGDDRIGLERHGTGDGHALALTARELAGHGAQGALGQTDELDELLDALLLLGRAADLMDQQRVEELIVHDHAGVKRGGGVLEHDGHDAAHLLAEVGRALGDVLALEVDLAGRRRLKAAHDVGGSGLAAAGLAHDADGLAGHELDGDVIDRVHQIGVQ